MKSYVFGAGVRTAVPQLPASGDLVIAADGGYDYCLSLGINPDILVADFDSLDGIPGDPALEIIRLPKAKDDTDTMAALKIGLERGADEFHIFGGTGGRVDHSLANLQCLAWLSEHRSRGWLYTPDSVLTMLSGPDSMRFPATATGFVSVFAYSDHATGVSETGLKYGLDNANLTNSSPIGVSNEFIGQESEISVGSGKLLISYPVSCIC